MCSTVTFSHDYNQDKKCDHTSIIRDPWRVSSAVVLDGHDIARRENLLGSLPSSRTAAVDVVHHWQEASPGCTWVCFLTVTQFWSPRLSSGPQGSPRHGFTLSQFLRSSSVLNSAEAFTFEICMLTHCLSSRASSSNLLPVHMKLSGS